MRKRFPEKQKYEKVEVVGKYSPTSNSMKYLYQIQNIFGGTVAMMKYRTT